ncbi:Hypothetical protein GbCGDNIH6_0455 [Granulibacter bethesdensis]|nr:Hypothetical protein GbCGDNIH6_0455 [Granulibacter bethesdensis]
MITRPIGSTPASCAGDIVLRRVRILTVSLLVPVVLGLNACGSSNSNPSPSPVAAATSLDAYDGSYTGSRTISAVKGSRAKCGQDFDQAAIRVTHGMAILRFIAHRHPVVFRTPVAPDGTFMSTFKGNTLDGHFTGDSFEGVVDTRACTYQVQAKRDETVR